ncbi:hypothetical protein [Ruminococcus sp.]|uniref:hypothetical protein n=1 Tax=Ruminococcus sp. TaxID=41978 RepID=UPI0025DFF486|nr:hypothetical protein [Ruminococcus sp.]
MKKLITMVVSLGLCGVLLAGCSRNTDESSSMGESSATTTSKASTSSMNKDDSNTLMSRVEDGVKDTVSGGAEIIGDTVSTAESVVDDLLR